MKHGAKAGQRKSILGLHSHTQFPRWMKLELLIEKVSGEES